MLRYFSHGWSVEFFGVDEFMGGDCTEGDSRSVPSERKKPRAFQPGAQTESISFIRNSTPSSHTRVLTSVQSCTPKSRTSSEDYLRFD